MTDVSNTASQSNLSESGTPPPPTRPSAQKTSISLNSKVATQLDDLAQSLEIPMAETVRRGLTLLQLLKSLERDEELTVRNRSTGEFTRIVYPWF